MTEQEQRLLRAMHSRLDRVQELLRGIKSNDASLQAWARVLDARNEIAITRAMLGTQLKQEAADAG